jgi:hypothetical protein
LRGFAKRLRREGMLVCCPPVWVERGNGSMLVLEVEERT